MATRRPLVLFDGRKAELPFDDVMSQPLYVGSITQGAATPDPRQFPGDTNFYLGCDSGTGGLFTWFGSSWDAAISGTPAYTTEIFTEFTMTEPHYKEYVHFVSLPPLVNDPLIDGGLFLVQLRPNYNVDRLVHDDMRYSWVFNVRPSQTSTPGEIDGLFIHCNFPDWEIGLVRLVVKIFKTD